MADDIDVANDLMDVEISRALSRLRDSKGKSGVIVEFCQECDDDLPDARKQMGFVMCVSCAEERERRQHLYSG